MYSADGAVRRTWETYDGEMLLTQPAYHHSYCTQRIQLVLCWQADSGGHLQGGRRGLQP